MLRSSLKMWKRYVGILCITLVKTLSLAFRSAPNNSYFSGRYLMSLSKPQVSASCPKHCPCLRGVMTCTSAVCADQDVSCGSCGVCPRQLFEDCSETRPCDHTKGLECNFGGRYDSATGICRAKSEGRTCEFNNKIHQNGEIFRPNCKHQCTCMDGAVGCVSLCPRELLLPRPGCFKPERVKIDGRCCEQLVCRGRTKPEISAGKKRKKKSKDRGSVGKKEVMTAWRRGAEPSSAVQKHPVDNVMDRQKCPPAYTSCSACSEFCMAGPSSRSIIRETHCTQMKKTLVCEIQPCNHQIFERKKKDKSRCPSQDAALPVKLSYVGCLSLRKFQPRCCQPGCRSPRSHTSPVLFRCGNKKVFSRMVTFTDPCECAPNKKNLNVLHAL